MPKSPRTRAASTTKPPTGRQQDEKHAEHTAKVDLPFVTAEFHTPHLPRMRPHGLIAATRSMLPSRRNAAYYGGLALLAAFELIEWPVAVAIGVGAAVMGRGHGAGEGRRTPEGDGHKREAPAGRRTSASRERTPAGRSTPGSRRK